LARKFKTAFKVTAFFKNKRFVFNLFLFLAISFFWPFIVDAIPPLEIHFIDVGQGDAIWIKGPNKTNILIDAGNLSAGYRVKDYLHKNGVTKLDAVIITHFHPDHVGGIFSVLPDLGVDKIYDNGADPGKEDVALEYLNLLRELGLHRGILVAGDRLEFGALRFLILSPSELLSGNWNTDSIVLLIRYGDVKALFMADATKKVEQGLVEKLGQELNSQILKVGHHGWTDATSDTLLDCVKPKVAVISAGKGNRHGYPGAAIVDEIQNRGINLLRTDLDGTIVFITDGKKIRVQEGSQK
jgi:competence protein ComEC